MDSKTNETVNQDVYSLGRQDIQGIMDNAIRNNLELEEKEDKFEPAPEVECIAHDLIYKYHSRLVNAKIKYLFRHGSWTSQKRETLGQAVKVAGVNQFLTGLDFIITINSEVWSLLDEKERIALIDHQLEHCCEKDGKYFIQGHDVEDFVAVIKRNGFWTPDLRKVENQAIQGKLFDINEERRLEVVK